MGLVAFRPGETDGVAHGGRQIRQQLLQGRRVIELGAAHRAEHDPALGVDQETGGQALDPPHRCRGLTTLRVNVGSHLTGIATLI